MWTRFMDMHSGGSSKEKWEYIYIEATESEAKIIFYNRFGHNPERITCTCCGEDYSISESETLSQASGYDRGCEWDKNKRIYIERPSAIFRTNKYKTLDQYMQDDKVLFIWSHEIKDHERKGDIPQQGYIWVE